MAPAGGAQPVPMLLRANARATSGSDVYSRSRALSRGSWYTRCLARYATCPWFPQHKPRHGCGSDFDPKYPTASCGTPRNARCSTPFFLITEQSLSQVCPLPLQRALQWLLDALLVGVEKAPGMPVLPAICGSWCTVRFGNRPCCPTRLSRHFLLACYELSVRGMSPKCTKPRTGTTVAAAHALLLSSSGSPVVLETPKV